MEPIAVPTMEGQNRTLLSSRGNSNMCFFKLVVLAYENIVNQALPHLTKKKKKKIFTSSDDGRGRPMFLEASTRVFRAVYA